MPILISDIVPLHMFKPGFYTQTNYTFEQSKKLNYLGIVVQTLGPMLRLWRSMRYGSQLTPLRVVGCDCRSNLQKYHFHIPPGCASGIWKLFHNANLIWGRSNEQKYHPYPPRRSRGGYGSEISASVSCEPYLMLLHSQSMGPKVCTTMPR